MSTLKVNAIRGNSASSDAFAFNSSGDTVLLGAMRGGSSSSTKDGIEIDSNGYVKFANNPSFYCLNSGTGSVQGDSVTTSPLQFVNVARDVGGNISNSGSRFTAPVAGLYCFSGNPGYKQNGTDFYCRAQINGVDRTDVVRYVNFSGSHSGFTFCFTVPLGAGDYVQLALNGGVYHRNNTSVPNWWAGYLVTRD